MKKAEKGKYSNQKRTPDLDCSVCIHRDGCASAQEGKFCGQFRSKALDPQGQNPNRLWEMGEEVEF